MAGEIFGLTPEGSGLGKLEPSGSDQNGAYLSSKIWFIEKIQNINAR